MVEWLTTPYCYSWCCLLSQSNGTSNTSVQGKTLPWYGNNVKVIKVSWATDCVWQSFFSILWTLSIGVHREGLISQVHSSQLHQYQFSSLQFSSVQFSCPVVSNSLRPHESQHSGPPCPSPTPGVHSDSRPSSQWCQSAMLFSVVPFSSYPQSLLASKYFPMSQLFAWGGQSTGVSALASFLPKKSQGWSQIRVVKWAESSEMTPKDWEKININLNFYRHLNHSLIMVIKTKIYDLLPIDPHPRIIKECTSLK